MTRPTALSNGDVAAVRTIAGAIAADNSSLTDANISPDAAVNCQGFETILVGVEITAGSSPTATIEPLFYDANAADGSRWKRILLGAPPGVTLASLAAQDTGALDGTAFVEIRVYGCQKVFLRVKAVTNSGSTTALKILAMPGKPRRAPNPYN